jgi:hypothetical protein
MKWLQLLQQGHVDVDGSRYLLNHLLSNTFVVVLPATERHSRIEATVRVEYTSHCMSTGPKPGAALDFAQIGLDRRVFDHRGVARAVCFRRHRWSLNLPSVIQSIEHRKCCFSGRGNWFVVEDIDDERRRVEYEVFFQLRAVGARSLRLVIESAYVRDAGRDGVGVPKSRRRVVRFRVMVAKELRGETVRSPS